jgi:methylmalonyl-CoA mutase C-terminal domain/subunit
VIVAKPGLDGHDRGAKVVARAFRDAGHEVIYTGIFQTAEGIVNAVVQEDADVLGISVLSGSHLHHAEEISRLLREQGAGDILFVIGGTIPPPDVPKLKAAGVAEVFGPGSPTRRIVEFVERWAEAQGLLAG